jgi:chorismate synthase
MLRILTAGESHGQALVGILEGVPAGLKISADYVNHQLWRRQQGYGRGGRMRIEDDRVEILSGVRFGRTLGSPIALVIRNKDWENWVEKMAVERDGKGIE